MADFSLYRLHQHVCCQQCWCLGRTHSKHLVSRRWSLAASSVSPTSSPLGRPCLLQTVRRGLSRLWSKTSRSAVKVGRRVGVVTTRLGLFRLARKLRSLCIATLGHASVNNSIGTSAGSKMIPDAASNYIPQPLLALNGPV